MFSTSSSGRLHAGQILSLSDVEKWDPNAKEVVEVGQGLKVRHRHRQRQPMTSESAT